jgi:hypothetical protein
LNPLTLSVLPVLSNDLLIFFYLELLGPHLLPLQLQLQFTRL